MTNIIVRRYPNPTEIGWAGWLEPTDKTWIAFIDLEGRPRFFLERDPETGAVLSSDPEKRAEELRMLRAQPELGDGFSGGPSRKPPSVR